MSENENILEKLWSIIEEKSISNDDSSYTKTMLSNDINHIARKMGEEAIETIVAAIGQTKKDTSHANEKLILDAQLAVDGQSNKYPQFKGNVTTVYTHPLSQGGASNSHYDGNAQTYMDIGLAMGESMIKLIKPNQ